MSELDVVIPAGGELDPDFARVVGTKSKALITIEGLTVLHRTIEALRGSSRIRRIVVVGSQEVLNHSDVKLADASFLAVGSSPQNINLGVSELLKLDFPPEKVVIVTADLPFLTSKTVDTFLDSCPPESDFCLPLVSKEDFDEKFPNTSATFVKLAQGELTAGCMYLTSVRGLKVATPHLEELFKKRKSKVGMAMILGPSFVWDLMVRKLTVPVIEAKVQELLNVRGKAIPDSPAELALDIDYVEDYHYVVSQFKSTFKEPQQTP